MSEQAVPPLRRLPGAAERDPRRHFLRRRRVQRVLAWLVPTVFLVLWQAASASHFIDARLFPSPTTIWSEGVRMVEDGTLQSQLLVSLRRIAIGLFFGVISGVFAGFALGLSTYVRAAFEPFLSALYTVPKLALLPMLLLIFGIGETPKNIVVAITVFFFMWISTMSSITEVSEGYREAARAFGVSRWGMFRHVLFPAALPQMLVALRISTGVAVLVVVGVEFVQASDGIGQLIWFSWTLFLTEQMYVGIVAVALLGVALTAVVKILTRVLVPWATDNTGSGPSKVL